VTTALPRRSKAASFVQVLRGASAVPSSTCTAAFVDSDQPCRETFRVNNGPNDWIDYVPVAQYGHVDFHYFLSSVAGQKHGVTRKWLSVWLSRLD
jgi:hypothetical protein